MQNTTPANTPENDVEPVTDETAETAAEDTLDKAETATPQAPENETTEGDETDVENKGKAAREAARYRTRLRETETERDTLAHTLEAVQRQFVEHLVADRFEVPADLFDVSRVCVADLLDDDGGIDPAKVDEAAIGALKRRPGLRKATWPDLGQDRRPAIPSTGSRWSDVLSGNASAK